MNTLRVIVRHPLTDVVIRGSGKGLSGIITDIRIGTGARKLIRRSGIPVHPGEPFLEAVAAMIVRCLDGERVDFSGCALDFTWTTSFQKRVLSAARLIPYGMQWSYSVLAAEAGFPGAARAAGSVMRHNRFPLVIPCHRVVRKDGRPGSFCGSSRGEDAMLKRKLLEMEAAGAESSAT